MYADDINLTKQITSLHVHLIMWFMLRKLFPAQQILQWPTYLIFLLLLGSDEFIRNLILNALFQDFP